MMAIGYKTIKHPVSKKPVTLWFDDPDFYTWNEINEPGLTGCESADNFETAAAISLDINLNRTPLAEARKMLNKALSWANEVFEQDEFAIALKVPQRGEYEGMRLPDFYKVSTYQMRKGFPDWHAKIQLDKERTEVSCTFSFDTAPREVVYEELSKLLGWFFITLGGDE